MGRRILAFFLGFLLGIIFVFGAVAAALYYGATVMHPSDVYPDSSKFLGDLADMSLYDIYDSVVALYKEKVGITNENGQYFTLGEFLEHYHIDATQLFGGKEVPEEVLEVPIFEFINTENTDAAMKQVKVSALFALVNAFTANDESGGMFSQEMLDKLAEHNLAELFNEEQGVTYVFKDVKFCDVLPGIFPTDDNTDSIVMWALGQTSIGRLMAGFEGNLLRQFKENGAFAALGGLKFTQLLGENSEILSAIVKDYKISDLIDDDGNLNPDGIMSGLFIGELIGLQRNLLTEAQTDGYTTLCYNDNVTVLSKGDEYVLQVKNMAGEYEYYEGRRFCTQDHEHTAACYGYVWYASEDNKANGIFTAIADVTVGDLMSGSTDVLMDRFMDVTLGEILEGQEVSGAVDHLKDMTIRQLMTDGIDGIYFGIIFGYSRKQIEDVDSYDFVDGTSDSVKKNGDAYVRQDGNTWFEAELKCDDEHEHGAKCYQFVWYTNDEFTNRGTGVKAALSNATIGELNNINSFIMDMTLNDVFGGTESIPSMLVSLAFIKIRDLSTAINDMYLGEFLNYHYEETDGELTWYTCNPQEGEDHVHNDDCRVTGVMGKLAAQKIKDLSNIESIISDLTLYEVLGDDIPSMLKSIKDTKIGELSNAINDMYVGDLLEYHRETVDGKEVWYTCNHQQGDEGHGDACLATGVSGKLASKKITELSDLNDTIMSLTLYDVMGDNVPDALKSIQNTAISDLEDKMEKVYLGNFIGYSRNSVDEDEVNSYETFCADDNVRYNANNAEIPYVRFDEMDENWYPATLYCTNDNHTFEQHTKDCFSFVWYSTINGGTKEETGLMAKLASVPLGELSSGKLMSVITNTRLKDVIEIDGTNTLLSALGDVKVSELSSALNDMYVGTAMGFFHLVSDGSGDNGNTWYECNLGSPDGHTHGNDCAVAVKGLNAKMANLTIAQLNGDQINTLLVGLTMGDLIESNMMQDIKGDNAYKLAIIMCKTPDHKCQGENTVLGSTVHSCTFEDYGKYLVANPNASAEEFWLHVHGYNSEDELDAEAIAHRDYWKTLPLSQFISTVLDAI